MPVGGARRQLWGALGRLLAMLAVMALIASCGNAQSDVSNAHGNNPDAQNQDPVSSPEPTASEPLPVDESVTPSPEPTLSESAETAYDMPYLYDEYEEGTEPDLGEETGMYVFVHAAQEGVPFWVSVDAFEDLAFNARTPYYIDLDDISVNEYGSVGSGSIAVDNGHTDGASIYVEYHSFAGTIQSESCDGYECRIVMSWDGPD